MLGGLTSFSMNYVISNKQKTLRERGALSGLAREKSDPGRSLSSDVVLPRLSSSPPGRHAITDALVKLAKDAKEAGQTELANQILNSAKFSAKTEFKKVEKEA